jgi:hypothetical protein
MITHEGHLSPQQICGALWDTLSKRSYIFYSILELTLRAHNLLGSRVISCSGKNVLILDPPSHFTQQSETTADTLRFGCLQHAFCGRVMAMALRSADRRALHRRRLPQKASLASAVRTSFLTVGVLHYMDIKRPLLRPSYTCTTGESTNT